MFQDKLKNIVTFDLSPHPYASLEKKRGRKVPDALDICTNFLGTFST